MSIFPAKKGWFRAPHGFERIWIGISILWCVVLSIAMPWWHFKGTQTSSGEAYKVTREAFDARVAQFVASGQVGTHNGIPVVEPPPGGDAYIIGKNWQWYPIVKLKRGVEYRLHVSSFDYQHGFSLLPMNMNFHVLQGYDHVITLTPMQTGEFPIICNEFCGAGHHLMTGLIIVEE
jgi:cytochrome c oxidase subunit 2